MNTKVLIVDDDPAVRDRLGRAFSFTGVQVFAASSGETALLQVDLVVPDLIILDISSLDSDRWETLHQIRELPYIPVIALTHSDDGGLGVESLIHGADYSMTKPVRVRELQARARALLRRTQRVGPSPFPA